LVLVPRCLKRGDKTARNVSSPDIGLSRRIALERRSKTH
jgi:hypothetical protein